MESTNTQTIASPASTRINIAAEERRTKLHQTSQPAPGRHTSLQSPDSLTIYYDGLCPLCIAEIHFLAARNRRGLLCFVDISHKQFANAGHPVSCAAAMAQIHARLGNGELLTGVSVFAEAYRRAELPALAWLLSRTWARPILDLGYGWFARHRHTISKVIGPSLLRLTNWWTSRRKQISQGS